MCGQFTPVKPIILPLRGQRREARIPSSVEPGHISTLPCAIFCTISVKESSFPQPLSNYPRLSDSPPAASKKCCCYNYHPLFFLRRAFFNQNRGGETLSSADFLRIANVFRRSTLHLQRQPGEIRRTSPLSVFQVGHLLLWPSLCPAVTWLCLIPLRSSESRSLILPTLCPTSLHNLPSPNFPYRSH